MLRGHNKATLNRETAAFPAMALVSALLSFALHPANALAGPILLCLDTHGSSPCQRALENGGYVYQSVTDDASFSAALASVSPPSDIVVVDSTVNHHAFGGLAAFVNAGGRVLLQYWDLGSGSALPSLFGVSVIAPLNSPRALYTWNGANFIQPVSSPVHMVEDRQRAVAVARCLQQYVV